MRNQRTTVVGACLASVLWLLAHGSARADKPLGATAQTLKLPNGPSALKGLGESFEVSASTGMGTFSIPLLLPPAALAPSLSLAYAAGSGRSELGVSFRLPILSIYRQTDKGAPRYDESDRFAVRSESLNDELVLVDEARRLYRLKNEGAFALFERSVSGDLWRVHLPNGRTLEVGGAAEARETSLGRTHRWYVTAEHDLLGHGISYRYFKEDDISGRVYLSSISYQLHAAEAYRNHVELQYEQRPDITMDASSGEAIVTSLRVSEVVVRQGPRVLRRYHLRYQEDSLLSTLVEVELEGEHGERMPVLTLEYVERTSSSGQFVQMRQLPPLEGLSNGDATLEDVTGDGLPDLLIGQAGAYAYYENLDGVNWSTVRTELRGDPERSLGHESTVFADVDGDGARDVVYSDGAGFRYMPAGRVVLGVYQGFAEPRALSTLESGLDLGSPTLKLVDLNGDGRTDLLSQRPGQDVQILNENGERLVAYAIPELPLDVQLDDPRVELLDFNGDGVLDFVRTEIGYTVSRVRVWYGLGGGRYMAEQQMLGVPRADGTEFSLHDVNRDGQSDLVRVSGTTAAYYLNDGHGMFLPKQGTYRGLPSLAETQRLLFADLNGNGTTDLVWLTRSGKLYYLDLVGAPFAGLLSRIDNGMGLVTELAYRSSTDFAVQAKRAGRPWRTWLPHPMAVIAEQRVSDSLDLLGLEANVLVTTFDYAEGYWDGREREFRGFGRVTTTEWGDASHETLVTEQRFHLGRNFESGSDEEALKGRLLLAAQRNEKGEVYATSETQWERRSLCRASGEEAMPLPLCDANEPVSEQNKDRRISLVVPRTQLSATWEKTSAPRFAAVETEHDAFGNPTVVRKWGEVRLARPYEPGKGFELGDVTVGDDEVIEETEYLTNLGEWLIGFPFAARIKSLSGEVTSENRTFYDDPYADRDGKSPDDPHSLSRGLPTLVQGWLRDEQRWVTLSRVAYDDGGMIAWQEDGTGARRRFERDPRNGWFSTAEVIEAGSEGAPVELRYEAEYDPGQGTMLALEDPNGNRGRVEYDGLGRVTQVFNPQNDAVLSFSYEYGTPISSAHTRRLIDRATQQYVTSIDYVDGAGRVRLRKSEAEQPYGYVATGWADLSGRGAAVRTYRPFATVSAGFEPPPAAAESGRSTYDALGRVLATWRRTTDELSREYQVSTPFTQTSAKEYGPWTERTYRERDLLEQTRAFPTVVRNDGLGRARKMERFNLADGREQRLSWTLSYDPRGLLTSFADASHTRRYGYDSLGQLRTVDDANLGATIRYQYDDALRPVRREDGLGQVQTWAYDRAGRLLEHALSGHASLPDSAYRYVWDEADPRFSLWTAESPTNLRGRLARMEFPTGATHYSYDFEGRTAVEVSELWNPEARGSTFEHQVRDAFVRRVSYDDAGRPVRTSDGDVAGTSAQEGVSFALAYNARSLPVSVRGGFGGQEQRLFDGIAYRDSGEPIATDLGNGLRSCAAYDGRELLERVLVDRASETDCTAVSYSGGHGILSLGYRHTFDGQLSALDDLSVEVRNVPRLGVQYEYDRIGQLTRALYEEPTFGAEHFEYDEIQNLVRKVVEDASGREQNVAAYFYNEGAFPSPQRVSRVVRNGTSVPFVYDALGQLQEYEGYALVHDVEGRLARASRDGAAIEHHFDGTGSRRISIEREADGTMHVERLVSDAFSLRDGDEVSFMRAGLGAVELRRARGITVDASLLDELDQYVASGGARSGLKKPLPQEYLDLDGNGGEDFDLGDLRVAQEGLWSGHPVGGARSVVRYQHSDHLGSATHVTDTTGALVTQQKFSSYGQPLSKVGLGSLFGFTGQRRDLLDLGLVHMGAREYAPALGRWITPDRALGESPAQLAASVLEANLYAYVANNPAYLVDPHGSKKWWQRALGVVQAVGGALEVAAGAAIVYGTGGAGVYVGGALMVHGTDTMATGALNAVTDDYHRTATAQTITSVAKVAGADDETAESIGDYGDMAVGIGLSSAGTALTITSRSTAPTLAGAGSSALESEADDLSRSGQYLDEAAEAGTKAVDDVAKQTVKRGAQELGGFAYGVEADTVRAINRGYGGVTELNGTVEGVLAQANWYSGFYRKAAVIIRGIAGNHLFDNGNKRTAMMIYMLLRHRNGITTGVTAERDLERIIQAVAEGTLDDVDDIANLLRGE